MEEDDEEFYTNSNIICLENFNDNVINQNTINKGSKPKKGKLYKGANWNAYKRENLGSIPKKFENVLIEEKTSTQKGFSSQCERFTNTNQTIKYTYPGPGAYDVMKNIVDTKTSNSSKGYCNGFISTTNRFDDIKEFYDKYLPGPGQHKLNTDLHHENIEKSLKYQSLFSKASSSSLKPRVVCPGPGYYNPQENILPRNPSVENHYFKSKKDRFDQVTYKKVVPGPGRYFKNLDFYIPDKIEKASFFFRKPPRKKENLIEKYIKTNENSKKSAEEQPSITNDILYTEPTTNYTRYIMETDKSLTEELQNLKTLKTLTSTESKTDFYEIPSCFDKYKNQKSSPSGNRKDDPESGAGLFKKDSLPKFKVPGPAYYNPILPTGKVSFNSSEKKKIWIG